MGAEVIAVSTDNVDSLIPWAEMLGISYAAAADFWPHGQVSLKYDVLRPEGVPDRAMILVDRQGIIRFIELYGEDELPPMEPVVETLRELVRTEARVGNRE